MSINFQSLYFTKNIQDLYFIPTGTKSCTVVPYLNILTERETH